MIQHSGKLSFYRDGLAVDDEELRSLSAELGEVDEVQLYVIGRESLTALQGKALIEFWRKYFRFSETVLASATRWPE